MTHSDNQSIDRKAVAAELAPAWLTGLDGAARTEGAALLEALVADWAREAESDRDPPSVLKVQRADLDEAGRGKAPAARLDVLRAEVVGRSVNRLSVASYALGTALLDGRITPEAARAEGQKLLDEVGALQPAIQRIGDEASAKRLRRDANEVMMEGLYAVERKAMSLRLSRYQADHPTPRR